MGPGHPDQQRRAPVPAADEAACSATKAALSNLTVSLSKELAGTGAANASPGPALTDGFRDLALTFAQPGPTLVDSVAG